MIIRCATPDDALEIAKSMLARGRSGIAVFCLKHIWERYPSRSVRRCGGRQWKSPSPRYGLRLRVMPLSALLVWQAAEIPIRTPRLVGRAFYVHPKFWRRGAGRALWTEADAYFKLAGYSEVTLWVLRENQRARSFYLDLGFLIESSAKKSVEFQGARCVESRLRLRLVS